MLEEKRDTLARSLAHRIFRKSIMPHIGWPELLIFAAIVLLLFGSRLPSVMRSLGSSITEFKKGTRDADNELEERPKP